VQSQFIGFWSHMGQVIVPSLISVRSFNPKSLERYPPQVGNVMLCRPHRTG
jgi:hypothetical protein